MPRVSYNTKTKVFSFHGLPSERGLPEKAQFFFNPMTRAWETAKLSRAIRLREYFDESARELIECTSVKVEPWPGNPIVPPHQKLKAFQILAVKFALERNHSYIAFEQGLGKSVIGCTLINTVSLPTLIICPTFLVETWKREIRAWVRGGNLDVVDTGKPLPKFGRDVLIIPDNLLERENVQELLRDRDFGLLIVDEIHRFKNAEAKRTANLFKKIIPLVPKVVGLSGTPMPNRPIELFPVLSHLAHDTIDYMKLHDYGSKFCNGHETKFGWDYRGSSNLTQLHRQIHGRFMFRKTKEEVLPELEPKEERIIVLAPPVPVAMLKKAKTLERKYGSVPEIIKRKSLGDIAAYRRELGLLKVPPALEYIREVLDTTSESILVFAWHTGTLGALYSGLNQDYSTALIDGSVPMQRRDEIVEKFQKGKTRVLVAQVQTMVGLTLTRATRGVFVEFSWSPADNDQAADRMHRIGQKDSVTIDYLVLAKTHDETVMDVLLNKKDNINQVLKGDTTI
jgi:SWI/SNF-related matrix-associated actin-dependent regulator 1 of chromatin subfamily A